MRRRWDTGRAYSGGGRLPLAALRPILFAIGLLAALPAHAAGDCSIEHAHKLGVGTYNQHGATQLDADLDELDPAWYYNWLPLSDTAQAGHVPMVWSGDHMALAGAGAGPNLLTFNEPDVKTQANMSVEQALDLWPALMATGKRLGSPATSTGNEVGADTWLGRFMAGVEERGYRVDFIAVHYYPTEPGVEAFRRHLERIHQAYARPIWVTEWALADFSRPSRFSEEEQLRFYRSASEMLDDLPYVERHAWFGLYDGLDGWDLNSAMIEDGDLTSIGEAYRRLVTCAQDQDRVSPAVEPAAGLNGAGRAGKRDGA